jgi:hypothetical protein
MCTEHSSQPAAPFAAAAAAVVLHGVTAEHQYTESNLRFEQLKGKDKGTLLALSACPDLDAHLVLITRTVTGSTVRL